MASPLSLHNQWQDGKVCHISTASISPCRLGRLLCRQPPEHMFNVQRSTMVADLGGGP